MPANPYGRMQLLRLSPNTGKALTRLNVFQGQILHGKVFKMENFSAEGTLAKILAETDVPKSGGIAKIALGSHLIEAVVSQPLAEGSNVKLEVVKLADESFTLKLLEINGEAVGRNEPAVVTPNGDLAEWSSQVRDSLVKPDVASTSGNKALYVNPQKFEQQITQGIAKPIDFNSIPKPIANLIRTAINEGFINPGEFTVNNAVVKSSISKTLAGLYDTVDEIVAGTSGQSGQVKGLAESVKALTEMLKPVIETFPAKPINVEQPPASTITTIKEIAATLKAYIPEIETNTAIQNQQQVSNTGNTGTQVQVNIQTQTARNPVLNPQQQGINTETQGQATQPGSGQSQPVNPDSVVPPPSIPQTEVALPLSTLEQESDAALTPLKLQPGEMSDKQGVGQVRNIAGQSADGTSTHGRIQDSASDNRNLLFGLRMLSKLTDLIAQSKGFAIEESTRLTAVTSRLNSISNALEGTIVSPIFTHSIDTPDLIPRILLTLLFPGGHAELGIMVSDSNSERNQHTGDRESEESQNGQPVVGVIRISTDVLGDVGARVEYKEGSDAVRGLASGKFTVNELSSGEFRSGLPSLESALDARGIKSGGFRILETGSDQKVAGNKDGTDRHNHGLDIKI